MLVEKRAQKQTQLWQPPEPKSVWELLSYDDLPTDLQYVADRCGFPCVVSLLKRTPRMTIYVPQLTAMPTLFQRWLAQPELTGKTCRRLAQEAGTSESYIRKLKW